MPETLRRDDRERLAKGLNLYKEFLATDASPDLAEYNQVELAAVEELAERLELDSDYFHYNPARTGR